MDLATVLGLIIGFGSLLVAHVLEAEVHMPTYFYGLGSATAALVVFGGTIGALMVTFPMEVVTKSLGALSKTIFHKEAHDSSAIVDLFVRLAEKARREGLLSLEEEEEALSDPFMRKGVMLVVDGQDPELIRGVLEIDVEMTDHRHETAIKFYEAAGGYSPTMGIIGTVMGLINVLASLEDPSQLGAKVAVAFAATLYGVGFANLVWLPLAAKLKTRSREEAVLRQMMIEGILSVQAGENPRIIKDKLEGYLTPAQRRRRAAQGEAAAPAAARAA